MPGWRAVGSRRLSTTGRVGSAISKRGKGRTLVVGKERRSASLVGRTKGFSGKEDRPLMPRKRGRLIIAGGVKGRSCLDLSH